MTQPIQTTCQYVASLDGEVAEACEAYDRFHIQCAVEHERERGFSYSGFCGLIPWHDGQCHTRIGALSDEVDGVTAADSWQALFLRWTPGGVADVVILPECEVVACELHDGHLSVSPHTGDWADTRPQFDFPDESPTP